VAVGALVVVSALAHSLAAWRHTVPRLFPDEYIYTAISRSIGHGHLQIRGETVHFPAIFEPIVAAPIWRLFEVGTAYHLVQTENAVAASLAAIPIYLLARSLQLPRSYALGAVVYGLAIPELVLVAYTSSDAVGFPLIMTAIYLGVSSLDTGSSRQQIGFLAFATLATLTRVEYVALVPAYVIAAVAVERRNVWRRHRIALAATIPIAVVFVVAVFGYYAGERDTALNGAYVKWFFLQMFLVTVASGTVLIPGAVAALTKPQTRRELVFAIFAAALALLVIAEATAHSANSGQFKERYVYIIEVLAPIAFGLYMKNRRPGRPVVIVIALAVILAAARLPLSAYTEASFKTDSQFLFAVSWVQDRLGTANGSLLVAVLATAAALGALAVMLVGGRAGLPLALAACFVIASTVIATHADVLASTRVRRTEPPDLTWVNSAAHGSVDAIETPYASRGDLLSELYWNDSIKRELLFGNAGATDAFSAPVLRIGRDGTLLNAHRQVLFHFFGTTAVPANAVVVAAAGKFALWRAQTPIRLRLAIEGRYYDSWLTRAGRLRAWTAAPGSGLALRFELALPADHTFPVRLRLGRTTVRVNPGERVNVTCTSQTSPLDIRFSTTDSVVAADLRSISVELRQPAVRDRPRLAVPRPSQCVSRPAG
jgi:hypothetical protein